MERDINPIAFMLGFICPPLADYVEDKMAESRKHRELEYERKKLELEKLRKELEE